MKTFALALSALAATTTAVRAQVPEGQGVPDQYWGKWALTARACAGSDIGRGAILVDEGGYTSDGERNAAIRHLVSRGAHRITYDVIFSAVADRQWEGRMTLRRVGARLGVTNGPNREKLYVRCR